MLVADDGAEYDERVELDLSKLEPMIALPSSPGNVKSVAEVAGKEVYQAYIGSSANPGYRDFAVPAMMVDGRRTQPGVSFDINPTSRQILENLSLQGHLARLIRAGARLHQAGCNGCIGMGQAPATDGNSLRTVPRNFPGRSGTREDRVFLCSPETATAAALTGKITDPRELDMDYPVFEEPGDLVINREMLMEPADDGGSVELIKGPNVKTLPEFEPIADDFSGPVLLKVGDDVSTDEIMPAGAEVLPYRSNIPKMADFVYRDVDSGFVERAKELDGSGFAIVGGRNYGQGSSREHAAIAPRYLGLQVVCAISWGRIHWQNLANFGILPLTFADADDYEAIEAGDELGMEDVFAALEAGDEVIVKNVTQGTSYKMNHGLSERQIGMIRAGSLIARVREES